MAHWGGAVAPASRAAAITPSNDTDFELCDAIYVGSAGNVVVVFKGDTAVTFTGVPAGTVLPVRAVRVNSTSTTASSLVALYTRN